jgi:nitrogen fixation/metabolism regulation signal transduction histidine kinase
MVVHGKIQFGILFYMAGLAMLSSFLSVYTLTQLAINSGTMTTDSAIPVMVVCQMILLVVWLLAGLFFTNRIFGPLLRLHGEINALREGEDRPPVKLRKGDHFVDLIDDFNAMAATYRQAIPPKKIP